MAILISVYDSNGDCVGRCDSRCYEAKHPECDCICQGTNHGKGFKFAMEHAAEIVDAVEKSTQPGQTVHNEAKNLKLIVSQGTERDEDLDSHFYKKVVVLPDQPKL